MKTTINAKVGYHVKRSAKIDELGALMGYDAPCLLLDGDEPVMIAGIRSYVDYRDELVMSGNEAAVLCEVFKTRKGNIFAYWRDNEADQDYLTNLYLLNGGIQID